MEIIKVVIVEPYKISYGEGKYLAITRSDNGLDEELMFLDYKDALPLVNYLFNEMNKPVSKQAELPPKLKEGPYTFPASMSSDSLSLRKAISSYIPSGINEPPTENGGQKIQKEEVFDLGAQAERLKIRPQVS